MTDPAMNSKSNVGAFLTLCSVGLFARLSYAMARTPVLALFALHLGARPEAIGLVVGISTVTGIFFKLPAGVLSDILGRRSLLIAGLCVFAFVPFGYIFVDGVWDLVVIRFFHGFATAIYGPVAMATIADVAKQKKAEQLSWFSSITIIGTLCGAPAGGFLLWWLPGSEGAALSDFHLIYTIIGGFGVIALILAITRLGALKPGEVAKGEHKSFSEVYQRFISGIKELISDRDVVITSSMEGLQNMTLGALEAFLPVYAVTIAGLNAFQAGALWGIQIVVTLAAKPIMGRIADRFGRKPLIVYGMIFCAVAFILIPTVTTFVWLAALAILFGFGEAFVTSSAAAMVADMCEEKHYGAAMGTFGTIYDVGHASGPIAAGLLLAAFSGDYFLAFLPLGIVLLLGCALFAFTTTERKLSDGNSGQ